MLLAAKRALSGVPAPVAGAASAMAPAAAAGPLAVPVWARVPSAVVAAERGLKGACAPACALPRRASAGRRVRARSHSLARACGHVLALSPRAAVTPHWARYNVSASSGALPISEARRLPALSAAGADGLSGWSGGGGGAGGARRAIIYRASPSAMTSGRAAAGGWRVRASHASKWSNPLMGWLSSPDTLSPATAMQNRFETAEQASARAGAARPAPPPPPPALPAPLFPSSTLCAPRPPQAVLWCERNGVPYEVAPAATGAGRPGAVDNQYAYNFLSRETMSRMKRLGARGSRAIFAYGKPSAPAFVNARTTPFGAEAWAPSSASGQTAAAWTGPAWPPRRETH